MVEYLNLIFDISHNTDFGLLVTSIWFGSIHWWLSE